MKPINPAICTASVQQGEPVMLEQSGWLVVTLDAQALSTDSPSMENEAIKGTANVVPAITFLRNSRRLGSTLLRISSGAIVASLTELQDEHRGVVEVMDAVPLALVDHEPVFDRVDLESVETPGMLRHLFFHEPSHVPSAFSG